MQKQTSTLTVHPAHAQDYIIRGTILGLVAAIGYTAANVFLRFSTDVDPYWVSWVKAIPTVVIFGPMLFLRAMRSQALVPPVRPLVMLIAAAILGQVGGNVVFQWSLGTIGLALTVPICLGAMIMTGALSGWLCLKEQITWWTIASIVLLISAVSVLSLGAPSAQASLADAAAHDPRMVAMGVVAAFFSGVSYALLGVAIRSAAQQACPAVTNVVIVGLAGVIVLLPICLTRSPLSQFFVLSGGSLGWMIAAGLANALAFIALTKSLQLIGVIYVNALNATQAAMAAVAGVAIFQEPPSAALLWGVLLTAVGLGVMRRDRPDDEDIAAKVPDNQVSS